MIVVSNTTPLHYLVLIGESQMLPTPATGPSRSVPTR